MTKVFTLGLMLILGLLLTSCRKYTFNSADLDGVWTMKKETIVVGGQDFCKYEHDLVLLQFDNNNLAYSSIYPINEEDNINQETLNINKTKYEENFIKLLKFSNNKIVSVYDDEEKTIKALSLSSVKMNNDFIEVRFLNNRTDEDVLISEIYILLKKTNLKF